MHTDNIMLFIFIGLTTLIPILPAYIFYKILPGKTSQVDGTFHTLKFKLSGAFAGYFLIVFILIMVFKDSLKKTDEWQIWEVEGSVYFEGGYGTAEAIRVCINPPNMIAAGNKFKIKVLKRPGIAGQMEFPQLFVTHENFISKEIVFTENDIVDKKSKKIKLGEKVVLSKTP